MPLRSRIVVEAKEGDTDVVTAPSSRGRATQLHRPLRWLQGFVVPPSRRLAEAEIDQAGVVAGIELDGRAVGA